ncbi:hypothetical protein CGC56_00060 [Capnocytophaga canimorsus]|uniref:Uncharacterized protein n=1 Tax=Capnocytophaga canimorsus TaxID=28188 RepID=A0A250G1U9_9FLAO|nr:hypothetical protein CGC56_00060 [Capnocytophaga canimorsus]
MLCKTQRNATQRNATQRNATQRLSYPLIKNLLTHVYTFLAYTQHCVTYFFQFSGHKVTRNKLQVSRNKKQGISRTWILFSCSFIPYSFYFTLFPFPLKIFYKFIILWESAI